MTQKERRQQGLYFDASDPEVIEERMRAQRLINRFNRLDETEQEEAQRILHELLGSIEGKCYFVPPIFMDYGSNIHVGDCSFFNTGFTALDAGCLYWAKCKHLHPTAPPTCRGTQHILRTWTSRDHWRQRLDRWLRHHPWRRNHRRRCGDRCRQRGDTRHPNMCCRRWQSMPSTTTHHRLRPSARANLPLYAPRGTLINHPLSPPPP